jgi:type II secretory pathway predicted ATPase ExeA
VSIEKLQAHHGFTRIPFRRDLAPGMLHRHAAHAEAAARIAWCISEHALGVITGEVGAGKTVALRAALASLDPSRHTLIYLGNPSVGVRGINHAIVAALGGVPKTHHATLTPQAMDLLAREHAERGRIPVLAIDEAHMLQPGQLEAIRMLTTTTSTPPAPWPACSSASPPCAAGSSSASSPPSTSASPSATPCPA